MSNYGETTTLDHAHLAESRKQIGTRLVSAIATGCLAISLCPAIALAAPADQAGPNQNGRPAAMQALGEQIQNGSGQADQGRQPDAQGPQGQRDNGQAPAGQAPDGQPTGQAPAGQAPDGQPTGQAPDGQAPDGQPTGQAPDGQKMGDQAPGNQAANGQAPQGHDDVLDGKIKEILSSQFGINVTLEQIERGNNVQPIDANKSPVELPEGEINVQQVIDSIRDLLRTYTVDELQSADFTDSDFASKLTEQVAKDNEERLARFASGEQPGQAQAADQGKGQQADKAPTGDNFEAEKAPIADGAEKGSGTGTDEASASNQDVGESLLTRLINFIAGVFGQKA